MAGNIKGITIEFDGKTTKLDAAIKKINKEANSLNKSLKNVDKALKFSPTNTELLAQKQSLLRQKVQATKDSLDKLKAAQAQMDAAGVDKSSAEYQNLRREIITTESKLKHFNAELLKANAAASKVGILGAKFTQAGEKIEGAGNKLRGFSRAAAVGLGASLYTAGQFETAMGKVATIADTSQVPIDDLKKSIMDLSTQYGLSSSELAEATYQALSASVATKDVGKFVEDAAKLAKAGFLETTGAVDVLTTVINAYGLSAKDASHVSDVLIQTQNDGKTTVNELAESMGNVIPTASALGVNLDNLATAYAIMTKQGINTANSTTYINSMLTELSKGGSTVSTILKEKTGKTFGELTASGKSLGDVLQILYDSVGGNSEAFSNLWGNVRAGKGALALVNGGAGEFNEELKRMQDAAKTVNKALEDMQTPITKLKIIFNSLKNIAILVGDAMLNSMMPALKVIADGTQNLFDKIKKLNPKMLAMIGWFMGIAAAAAPFLIVLGKISLGIGDGLRKIAEFGARIGLLAEKFPLVGKAVGLLKNPVFIIIAALVALGAIIAKTGITAGQLSAKITSFVQGLVSKIPAMMNIIIGAISTVLTAIPKVLPAVIQGIATLIQAVATALPTIIMTLAMALIKGISAILKLIPKLIPAFVKGFNTLFTALVTALPTLLTALVTGFTNGIIQLIQILPKMIPQMINGFSQLLIGLVNALPIVIPLLITAFTGGISLVIQSLPTLIPALEKASVQLFMALVQAIPQIVVALVRALPQIVNAFKTGLQQTLPMIWDSIKNTAVGKFINMVAKIGSVFGKVVHAIAHPFETAYGLVRAAINKIKAVVNAVRLKLDIKIPHISVHGGKAPYGIAGKGSLPSFNVNWYKTGGIFNGPSIIGVGEAGAEAVVPLDKLEKMMGNNDLAPVLAQMMGMMQTIIDQQNDPKSLNVNKREFGRLVSEVV